MGAICILPSFEWQEWAKRDHRTTPFAYLIEIGKGRNLIPQRLHDGPVFVQACWVDGALALHDGGTQSHALEVVVIQEAIVVNIWRFMERDRRERKTL